MLDGDDQFKKKISTIFKMFKKNKNLNFIQDKPFLTEKIYEFKKKIIFFQFGQVFTQQVAWQLGENFLEKFMRHLEGKNFPNLEIDARLSMFAFIKNEFLKTEKRLTIYNYDEFGITSNYAKFNINWWKKEMKHLVI